MTTLELARSQFAITTLFHFIFVPLSIGLVFFVATCQTIYWRTGAERWRRLTKFFGKLMLISFAVGVATGIVQEFQFGMNWSEYSRYVGDVFGAPLAIEGLAAFFVESTFLGLWLFGWDKLRPGLHLACIWAVSIGTLLSAYFILAANSWMQNPVGYEINPETGRAEMTDALAVLFNETTFLAFGHTVLGALATGTMVALAVCAYHLLRRNEVGVFGAGAKLALGIACAAALGTATLGHFQGMLVTEQQPMKMAAAEAFYETREGAPLSLFAIAPFERNPGEPPINIEVPKVLSFMATGDPEGTVKGINQVQEESVAEYGPGDYVPIVGLNYWAFRIMVGAGVAMILLTAAGLLLARRRRLAASPLFLKLAIAAAALPFIANSAGWIFREMGRQPWVVQGLLKTADGVSPHVGTGHVLLTFGGFFVIYSLVAAIAGRLFWRHVKRGPSEAEDAGTDPERDRRETALALTY